MQFNQFLTFLTLALLAAGVNAQSKNIVISSEAPYRDTSYIKDNVLNECTNLGKKFSLSTKKYLENNGWQVKLHPEPYKSDGDYRMELMIDTVHSGGNAFIGHSKEVTMTVNLYKGNELLDNLSKARRSGGGFGGGFKSSCAVLERCLNTLGKDVSKWVRKKKLN